MMNESASGVLAGVAVRGQMREGTRGKIARGKNSAPTSTNSNGDRDRPRVRYGTLLNVDTWETTPCFLYSHEEIDAEIDRRIRIDLRDGNCGERSMRRRAPSFIAF